MRATLLLLALASATLQAADAFIWLEAEKQAFATTSARPAPSVHVFTASCSPGPRTVHRFAAGNSSSVPSSASARSTNFSSTFLWPNALP